MSALAATFETPDGAIHGFTTDIIVIGYIAAWWASAGGDAGQAQPGWGRDLKRQTIMTREGESWVTWVCGLLMRDGVQGLQIVKHWDVHDNGKRKEMYWMPLSACKSAKVTFPGLERID